MNLFHAVLLTAIQHNTSCFIFNKRHCHFTKTVSYSAGDMQMNNNVNNQQDATTFSFINLFNPALHFSGKKFAHPQEHFLIVYAAFDTMQRHCC